jgi:hypothetical protein
MEAYCSRELGVCALRVEESIVMHGSVVWGEEISDSQGVEDENGDLIIEHEGNAVIFTPELDDDENLLETSDDDNVSISMSIMSMEQNNLLVNFEWIDETTTDETITDDAEVTIATLPTEDSTTTVPPDDGNTDFSWVILKEDEGVTVDAALEISMSMEFEELSADYTWIVPEKVINDKEETNAAVVTATFPTKEIIAIDAEAAVVMATAPADEEVASSTTTTPPDDNDINFTWINLK